MKLLIVPSSGEEVLLASVAGGGRGAGLEHLLELPGSSSLSSWQNSCSGNSGPCAVQNEKETLFLASGSCCHFPGFP